MFNKELIYKILFYSFIALCLMVAIISVNGAAINIDHSIPKGLYWEVNNSPKKDDYVLCEIKNISRIGTQRNYSKNLGTIGKRIIGVPGDTVKISSNGVTIDGKFIDNSKPLLHDSEGREMPVMDSTFVLKNNHYFLFGNHPESFDSRYFGAVNKEKIVSAIIPIITF